MKKLETLVVGTGRCGTAYMANLLTSMGVPCGHEAIFTERGLNEAINRLNDNKKIKFSKCITEQIKEWTVPEEIIADSSYLSAPFLDHDILKDTTIIHVIRNPMQVITSFYKANYFSNDWPPHTVDFQNFIKSYVPNVYENNLNSVNRAALYFIEWNRLIEKKSKKRFLYNINNDPEILLKFLNKNNYDKNLSKKINSWKKDDFEIKITDLDKNIRNKLINFIN
jgi:hypothetical protein